MAMDERAQKGIGVAVEAVWADFHDPRTLSAAHGAEGFGEGVIEFALFRCVEVARGGDADVRLLGHLLLLPARCLGNVIAVFP